jgi:hypothetical protein
MEARIISKRSSPVFILVSHSMVFLPFPVIRRLKGVNAW